MDPVLILCKGSTDQIIESFSNISLNSIVRALSDYHYMYRKMDSDRANLIIDIMKQKFDATQNEYPFLTAVYILGLPNRLDEFVLPSTDPILVYKMKYSYLP